MCIGLREDFEASGDVCDEGTKKHSSNRIAVRCRSLRIRDY